MDVPALLIRGSTTGPGAAIARTELFASSTMKGMPFTAKVASFPTESTL